MSFVFVIFVCNLIVCALDHGAPDFLCIQYGVWCSFLCASALKQTLQDYVAINTTRKGT